MGPAKASPRCLKKPAKASPRCLKKPAKASPLFETQKASPPCLKKPAKASPPCLKKPAKAPHKSSPKIKKRPATVKDCWCWMTQSMITLDECKRRYDVKNPNFIENRAFAEKNFRKISLRRNIIRDNGNLPIPLQINAEGLTREEWQEMVDYNNGFGIPQFRLTLEEHNRLCTFMATGDLPPSYNQADDMTVAVTEVS